MDIPLRGSLRYIHRHQPGLSRCNKLQVQKHKNNGATNSTLRKASCCSSSLAKVISRPIDSHFPEAPLLTNQGKLKATPQGRGSANIHRRTPWDACKERRATVPGNTCSCLHDIMLTCLHDIMLT